jgi:hypothetical protein
LNRDPSLFLQPFFPSIHCVASAIAVDIARNVTMLGPIIAQRHQQLLAKFGSVGTVWRKLFKNPKAQCLLGCLSQFGFGGTGSFDYTQMGTEDDGEAECEADAGSCEPVSGSSSSSSDGGLRAASTSPSAPFTLPFDISAMNHSELKAAAAAIGICLPDGFNTSSLSSFGKSAVAGVTIPSSSLPRPPHHGVPVPPQLRPGPAAAAPGSVPSSGECFIALDTST